MPLEFPSHPVPLNAPFYIERNPIEEIAYHEVEQSGSLVRIKAPCKMGKSSLLIRILAHAKNKGYQIVNIDFQEVDEVIYSDLEKFLRWFCSKIARELKLKPMLDEYWDEDMGSKTSSSSYLQEYILAKIDVPIVIALNEVNLIFDHPCIAKDFLPLLRFWHEQARQVEAFEKMRLVVVHSTEVYIPLNLNQSPFNVGLPIELPLFNLSQIKELAQRYELNYLHEGDFLQLLKVTGGHPYLVQLALYHISQKKSTIEELLESAQSQGGIYKDYLLNYWNKLQKSPELLAALNQLLNSEKSLKIEPIMAYKLHSVGIFHLQGDQCQIACDLYRDYFINQQPQFDHVITTHLKYLEQENQALKHLVNIDSLTQVANRYYFDIYLQQEWQRC